MGSIKKRLMREMIRTTWKCLCDHSRQIQIVRPTIVEPTKVTFECYSCGSTWALEFLANGLCRVEPLDSSLKLAKILQRKQKERVGG
jgi:hypothetical protein